MGCWSSVRELQKQAAFHQQFAATACYSCQDKHFRLHNLNLREKLKRQRDLRQHPGATGFVYAIFDTLNEEVYQEHLIQQHVDAPNLAVIGKYPKGIDAELVFTEQEIARVCIKYRLRFLDSAQFTAPMPCEALRRIKHLQKQTGHTFQSFRIVAPAEAFHLSDCKEDPLLFAELGYGRYAFLFQWGQDLHPLRYFPWRSRWAMGVSVAACAVLVTVLLVITSEPSPASDVGASVLFAFSAWIDAGLVAAAALVVSCLRKGFSTDLWQRPFS